MIVIALVQMETRGCRSSHVVTSGCGGSCIKAEITLVSRTTIQSNVTGLIVYPRNSLNLLTLAKSDPSEQGRDFGPKTAALPGFLLNRIAQDGPHLFLHAPTMGGRTPAELCLHLIFQIAHDELGHRSSPRYHDSEN